MFDNPAAADLIESLHPDCFIVCGVATDYCVKEAVDGLVDQGKKVKLVVDAIEGIDKGGSKHIIEEFRIRGVEMVTFKEVVEMAGSAKL